MIQYFKKIMTILLETTTQRKYANHHLVQVTPATLHVGGDDDDDGTKQSSYYGTTTNGGVGGEGREGTFIEKKNMMVLMKKKEKKMNATMGVTTRNKMKMKLHQQINITTTDNKLTGQDELRNVFLKMWDGKVRNETKTKRES